MISKVSKLSLVVGFMFISNAVYAERPVECPCIDQWAEFSVANEKIVSDKEGVKCSFSDDYESAFYKQLFKDDDVKVHFFANVEVPNEWDYQLIMIGIPDEKYVFACAIENFFIDDEGKVNIRTQYKSWEGDEKHVSACRKLLEAKGCK